MAKRKSDSTIDKIQLDRVIRAKQLPILTLDSRWHLLFPEPKKTTTIRRLEKQVNELLKHQGKIVQDAKGLKQLKRSLMQEIVLNMSESSGEIEAQRVKKLENSQKYIKEINDKLTLLDDELEQLPTKIREVNEKLMLESVSICYNQLRENKQQIIQLEEWIAEVRNTLKERVVQKQEMEEENTNIYSYMHDMLGAQVMEVFDSKQQDI